MRTSLALAVAWTSSAGAAVGLGFLALTVLDSPSEPLRSTPAGSTAEVVAAPTATTSSAAPSSSASASRTGSPVPARAEQVTVAGTVYAQCVAGAPALGSAPATGWWVEDGDRPDRVEFASGGQRVEVTVSCTDGLATFRVEGPGVDDRSDPSSSASSTPAPAASSASPSAHGTASSTASSTAHETEVEHGPETGDDGGSGHGGGSGSGSGGHGSDG